MCTHDDNRSTAHERHAVGWVAWRGLYNVSCASYGRGAAPGAEGGACPAGVRRGRADWHGAAPHPLRLLAAASEVLGLQPVGAVRHAARLGFKKR